ncbi:MAG TPA: efflux RND transporter periplasmic adaptor subunit [Gallionellaceae bacterium]
MMMPDKKILLITIATALVLVGAGYWGFKQFHGAETAETPAPQANDQSVADTLHYAADAPQLAFLQIKQVEALPEPLTEALNARIAYDDNHTARVFSPIAGRVLRISTEMGQWVKAGDPLVALDSPDFAQAVADSAKAEADLARKQKAYERAKQLLEVQGMARKDVEAAEADMQQADAEARRARAHMRNLNSQSLTSRGEFVLRAPVAGIVSERLVNVGSEVRPDATSPLFVITDPKRLWLQIDLPERQLGKVRVGQSVFIEVDAYPGETFPGKISIIGETLDPVTRRISVRCEITDAQQKLRPEMFARATPIADAKSRLPRIPNTALVTQGLYSYIFVEKSPGLLQRRRITLAMQGSEYSYVKEGLQAGERVVTSGALLLNSELSSTE